MLLRLNGDATAGVAATEVRDVGQLEGKGAGVFDRNVEREFGGADDEKALLSLAAC